MTAAPVERGVTMVATTPQQALTGIEVGSGPFTQCSTCHRSIGEASEVAIRAHRLSDEVRWTAAAIYCMSCLDEHGAITTPTAGEYELLVVGRLVLRGDAATQDHRLVFSADDGCDAVLDYSGPNKGSDP